MTTVMHPLKRFLALFPVLLLVVVMGWPVPAEAKLAFTRNYPDLKWNVIKTEHFNVFYPVSKNPDSLHPIDGEFTARKTAYVAEEMYPLVCGQFNYYLDETVNIVMLDQTDELTGYTIPNFDWIVVSGRHSDGLWRMRGHHDWLRNVMYHEFGHVVSLKADQVFAEESFGSYISMRWADGRYNTSVEANLFLGSGDPWFWVEGGAEYYTDVAGINNWTANRDMRMRMDVLEGTLLNFDDMADYYGSNVGFDGNRHYLAGYSFALYLEERFGEGVYQSFALKRDQKGWSPNWLSVIEDTLNISGDELYDDWRAWAMEKYSRVRDEVMEDPAIGGPLKLVESYWEDDAPSDIERTEWVKNIEGGNRYKWQLDRQKDGMSVLAPRMSDDGTQYARNHRWKGVRWIDVSEDEFPVLNPDAEYRDLRDDISEKEAGLRESGIVTHLAEQTFDFSPDGRKLLVTLPEDLPKTLAGWKNPLFTEAASNLDGYNWHTVAVVDLEELERLARQEMLDHFGYDPHEEDAENYEKVRRGIEVEKSPDEKKKGKKWKRRRWWNWSQEILPSKYIRTYPDYRRASDPAWSPDGQHIAFVRYDDGTQNVWVIDKDTGIGKAVTAFVDDGTRIEGLDWSPDGSQLVFGAYRYNHQDIYVVNRDGTGGRALTFDRFEDRDPHWGYDGNVYFSSDRVGNIFNIFRLDPRLEPGRLDRDLDGIADKDDSCPDEAETRNLFRDEDGCPDGIPIRVTKERIEIGETVYFEFDKAIIKPESYDLLSAVGRTLTEHPEILGLEIQGHTDHKGGKSYNDDLSQRRAEAVMSYLVARGVAVERLTAKGFGKSTPLVDEKSDEAAAQNRRVEFHITEREDVEELVEAGEEASPTGVLADLGPETTETFKLSDEQLANATLVQVTNVVGGAFTPWLTPKRNLLYSNYTAFGWKPYGLNKDKFHNRVVDDTSLVIDQSTVGFSEPQEEYPDYSEITDSVPVHGAYVRNPMIIPIIDLGNISLTHIGVNLGFQFWIDDALDTNSLVVIALAGEDLFFLTRYDNKAFWPEFYVGALLRSLKFDYGFERDEDGNTETEDDRFLGDIKLNYLVYGGFAGVKLPFSRFFNMEVGTFQYGLGIAGVDDGKAVQPLRYRANQNISFNFLLPDVGSIRKASRWASPVSAFALNWSPNVTIPLNTATAGVAVDDGQVFETYFYNEFGFAWTQYFNLPVKNKIGENAGHQLVTEVQIGFVDRNVPYGDEIRGGGSGGVNVRNPYSSNTTFAGYEPFSLAGETVALMNFQYSFPLVKNIDKKVGPIYFEGLSLSIFSTVGNFWSYRVEGEQTRLFGERVLADPEYRVGGGLDRAGSGIKREWPGMEAEENGQYILADAGLEIRLDANLLNRSPWRSFARIAYGFMPVSGRGDVDGDGVYTNSSDPTLNNRSDEAEPAGFRFYLGLGTGW